jgi:hypothetical protein
MSPVMKLFSSLFVRKYATRRIEPDTLNNIVSFLQSYIPLSCSTRFNRSNVQSRKQKKSANSDGTKTKEESKQLQNMFTRIEQGPRFDDDDDLTCRGTHAQQFLLGIA